MATQRIKDHLNSLDENDLKSLYVSNTELVRRYQRFLDKMNESLDIAWLIGTEKFGWTLDDYVEWTKPEQTGND